MATEEPDFSIVLQDGDFEIRDYPALVVAEVTVTGDRRAAANEGFSLLAGYIFGGNQRRQRIAMTTPVAQQPASEKIAMTAPVTQLQQGREWRVRFTMPESYTLETLPVPNESRVKLLEVPPTRYAVLKFSGRAREDSIGEHTAELVAAMRARGLSAIGPVSVAQYNPPWTPWFARRNEVMAPITAQ